MPDPYPKLLVDWILEHDGEPGFVLFLEAMKKSQEGYIVSALQPGDTDFYKGVARGFELAIELKDDVLTDSEESEKSEDIVEKEDGPKKETTE